VERWAELRREHFVRRVPIKELARRYGIDRNTVRRALRCNQPPRYERPPRPSKLDPFKEEIHELLRTDAKLTGVRVRELIEPLGFDGSKTIVDDYLREVRPLFEQQRTFQRTIYRPGEICQFDLWEPSAEIPTRSRPCWALGCSPESGRSSSASSILRRSGRSPRPALELLDGVPAAGGRHVGDRVTGDVEPLRHSVVMRAAPDEVRRPPVAGFSRHAALVTSRRVRGGGSDRVGWGPIRGVRSVRAPRTQSGRGETSGGFECRSAAPARATARKRAERPLLSHASAP
jgi:hypothetical protein